MPLLILRAYGHTNALPADSAVRPRVELVSKLMTRIRIQSERKIESYGGTLGRGP